MEHTNLILRINALDPDFSGTPQEFVDHFVERAEILSPSGFFNVIIADVAPTSNMGLLLLGGSKIYVWNEKQSKYIPTDITDSLYYPSILAGLDVLHGKWILVSDGGNWGWKKNSDFLTWLEYGLTNFPIGPSGTILSSLATVDWRTPAAALPDASVPVGKLQATGADLGKIPKVGSDAKVTWQDPPSLANSVRHSTNMPLPAIGDFQPLPRPSNTVLLKWVLVKVLADPETPQYALNTEIDAHAFQVASESSVLRNAFVSEETATDWNLIRHPSVNDDRLRLPNKKPGTGVAYEVFITESSWRCKAYLF